MDDLISRQAAISAICNACGKIDCDKMDKCEKLQLPPANCSEFPNNSDTISRQAAIDTVMECYDNDELFEVYEWKLNELPPIQPKRGRWVLVCDNNGMHFICNKCGAWRYHQEQKFCGECGADMREVIE